MFALCYWKVNIARSCGLPTKGKIYREEVGPSVSVKLTAFVCEDGDRAPEGSGRLSSAHGTAFFFVRPTFLWTTRVNEAVSLILFHFKHVFLNA
jgi:hypothetical protein